MKNTPAGWPRIAVAIFYDDALRAIDWLCRAFGFEVRLKVLTEAGRVQHSELLYGEGVIMVGQAGKAADHGRITRSPQSLGGANTQAVMVYVDDVDLHCARAQQAPASITSRAYTTTAKSTGRIAATARVIWNSTNGGSRRGCAIRIIRSEH
jgi:uncharacterized glyoxalase superfamily protein PhnB